MLIQTGRQLTVLFQISHFHNPVSTATLHEKQELYQKISQEGNLKTDCFQGRKAFSTHSWLLPTTRKNFSSQAGTFQGQTLVFYNTLGDFLTSRTRSNSNGLNPLLFPQSNFFLLHIKYLKKVETRTHSEHWQYI